MGGEDYVLFSIRVGIVLEESNYVRILLRGVITLEEVVTVSGVWLNMVRGLLGKDGWNGGGR